MSFHVKHLGAFGAATAQYRSPFGATGIRVAFRAPPPANPARIPVSPKGFWYNFGQATQPALRCTAPLTG